MKTLKDDGTPTVFGYFANSIGSIVASVSKLKWKNVIKTFFIILLFIFLLWVFMIALKGEIIESIQPAVSTQVSQTLVEQDSIKIARKNELLALTTQAEDNLNDASLAMRIEFDADRILISTFHDGEHTSGGYDMTKMDECYEKVCEERNITRITGYSRDEPGRYKNIHTKDLPIYRYLRNNNHCFVGTVDEIRKIDPDYAARMDERKMCYAAMYYINNGDIPLSIFSVSWRKGNEKYIPEESVLRRRLADIAKDIKPHLMVGTYYSLSN